MLYRITIIVIIIIICIIVILMNFRQTIVFNPTTASVSKYSKFYRQLISLSGNRKNVEFHHVVTPDNLTLDTIYVKNPDTDNCIIYFHGGAGNITTRFDQIKFLFNYASIIIFDYRSYGKSTHTSSRLTPHALQTDAYAIWSYSLTNLSIQPNQITLVGESLGCSVVLELTVELSLSPDPLNYPHAIILNSPIYSIESYLHATISTMRLRPIVLSLFKLVTVMLGIRDFSATKTVPYLNHLTHITIAHSPDNRIIPYSEAVRLVDAIRQVHDRVELVEILGDHADCILTNEYIYTLSKIFN